MKTWRNTDRYTRPLRVSTDGDVETLRDGEWVPCTPQLQNGYLVVEACRKKSAGPVKQRVQVHTLVARAFLGGVPAGSCVVHLNGNSRDCSAANLRVVSRWKGGSLGRREVVKADAGGRVLRIYPTAAAAAAGELVSRTTMSRWCRGECTSSWLRGDFRFFYRDMADRDPELEEIMKGT